MKRYMAKYSANRKGSSRTSIKCTGKIECNQNNEDLGLGFCKTLMFPSYKPQGSILGLTGGLWKIIADTLTSVNFSR